jgi:hypothetical protein
MEVITIEESFQALSTQDLLSTQDSWNTDHARTNHACLRFEPGAGFESIRNRIDHVDHYLWRLSDRHSDGSTDATWVKSREATRPTPCTNSNTDAFAREDPSTVAEALGRHLWGGKRDDSEEDNFVSWSSSLLYVLQYAYYKKARYPNCNFEDMYICVVDTTKFLDRVFASDMVLMEAFSQYGSPTSRRRLSKLKDMRQRGHLCFGEYLSQGALQIKGRCAIISMSQIVAGGLYDLREEFRAVAQASERVWATKTCELRRIFFPLREEQRLLATDRELDAAWCIGRSGGSAWLLPIALAFLALKPRHVWDTKIIRKARLCATVVSIIV